MIHLLTDPMIHLLTDPISHWLTDPITHLLTDPITHWLTDPITHWLTDPITLWLTDPITHLLTDLINHWLTDPINHLLIDPICSGNLIEMQDLLRICTSYMVRTSPRVWALVQILELDGSVFGFPLPFFGRLGWLRCLDVVPLGFLQRVATATPGSGSEGMGVVNLLRFSNLNSSKITY